MVLVEVEQKKKKIIGGGEMIYVTGDTHGSYDCYKLLGLDQFPEKKGMTKDDYVIICGDFGVIWDGDVSNDEKRLLDKYSDCNFTTLFVDGNHENHARLKEFPIKEWNGGLVHEIRPTVFHLMRGEVYTIEGKKFFTFGGARSHDIEDGILDPADPNFKKKKTQLQREYKLCYRILGESWWQEEMPNMDEMNHGLENLSKHGNKVDYIITHDCASSTKVFLGYHEEADKLNIFLEKIRQTVDFKHWYFGHYHCDMAVTDKERCLYNSIERIE